MTSTSNWVGSCTNYRREGRDAEVPLASAGPHIEASCVQIHVLVLNVRVVLSHLITASQEQSICSAHDVGLVHCCHFLSATGASIVKCKLSHSLGSSLCDQLDTLHNSRHHLLEHTADQHKTLTVASIHTACGKWNCPTPYLMLYPTVFPFSVLPDSHQVHILIASLISFQRHTRPHVCIQVEHSACGKSN